MDATVLETIYASDTDGDALTYSITAGDSNSYFEIDSLGQITLTTDGVSSLANDYERETNTHVLTISVSDGTNTSTVQVTLTETDVVEKANAIAFYTDSNLNTSASAYAESYVEGAVDATVLETIYASDTDGDALTYSITAGDSNSYFEIDSLGQITLTTDGVSSLANDYERETNTHVLTISVSDGTNTSTVQVTLTETDIDDTGPVITGPSGGAGSATSEISVNEEQTAVTQLSASETVTWSISGGTDSGKFSIATDGTITFSTAPDYESPTDSDTNNTYVLIVAATDAARNTSTQTITVTVLDVSESLAALNKIKTKIKDSLKQFAVTGLRDAVRFNENAMSDISRECRSDAIVVSPDVSPGSIGLSYEQGLFDRCKDGYHLNTHSELSATKNNADWIKRLQTGVMLEHSIGEDSVLAIGATAGVTMDSKLSGFSASGIDEQSLMINLLAKHFVNEKTWVSGYLSFGRAWYDFDLTHNGLTVNGDMSGDRLIYGASLARDGVFLGRESNLKLDVSRGVEHFDNIELSASLAAADSVSGVKWGLSDNEITRISLPLAINLEKSSNPDDPARSDFMMGLLCEDSSSISTALECGYQLGLSTLGKFDNGDDYRLGYDFEHVDDTKSHSVSFDMTHWLDPKTSLVIRSGLSAKQSPVDEALDSQASWYIGFNRWLDDRESARITVDLSPVDGMSLGDGGRANVSVSAVF